MASDVLDLVWYAVESVFAIFLHLDSFFGVLSIAVGFFTAFTVYRFVVRPLAGGGFVDPSEVLRSAVHAQKAAESDIARKEYASSTKAYHDSRAAFYKSKAAYYDSKRKR